MPIPPPFIYSLNHLFVSVKTHGYLFYNLVYNSTLLRSSNNYSFSDSQSSVSWLLQLFAISPSLCIFLNTSFFSSKKKVFQDHLCISYLSPRMSYFPRSPGCFYWGMIPETKTGVLGVISAAVVFVLPGLLR